MRDCTYMTLPFARTFVAAIALMLSVHLPAQEAERNHQLAESTSTELGKVQPLLDGKNAPAALAIIDAQIRKVAPDSFDMAILLQIKAQILLQNNQLREGIEPLEKCLILSDAHTPPYFEKRLAQEFVYFLAQLYFQEATSAKDSRVIAANFAKAESYMARWTDAAPKLTTEPLLFYASLLFNRATQDSEHVDTARLEKSLGLAESALRLDARPTENLYVLELACLLQLGRNAEAAEILELLLQRNPKNASYWQQLAAIYLSLDQTTRAIVTLERAQSFGYINTPKDNFNLIGIYFNIGQYEKAAELLEAGLKNGSLGKDLRGWELLSFSYQQLHREFKSIDALNRAIAATPDSGQLEYLAAQAYFSVEKNADALRHAGEAVRKGNLSRPYQAYLLFAYLSLEANNLEAALDASEKAIAFPEGEKEGIRMKSAILEAIADRDAKNQKL